MDCQVMGHFDHRQFTESGIFLEDGVPPGILHVNGFISP